MQTLFLQSQAVSTTMALQTFHTEFGEHKATLTVILVDGEPWFRGTEAAMALGYKDPRKAIRTHVADDDKNVLENLRRGETPP
jgi:prophage antirepressor-like protein